MSASTWTDARHHWMRWATDPTGTEATGTDPTGLTDRRTGGTPQPTAVLIVAGAGR